MCAVLECDGLSSRAWVCWDGIDPNRLHSQAQPPRLSGTSTRSHPSVTNKSCSVVSEAFECEQTLRLLVRKLWSGKFAPLFYQILNNKSRVEGKTWTKDNKEKMSVFPSFTSTLFVLFIYSFYMSRWWIFLCLQCSLPRTTNGWRNFMLPVRPRTDRLIYAILLVFGCFYFPFWLLFTLRFYSFSLPFCRSCIATALRKTLIWLFPDQAGWAKEKKYFFSEEQESCW